MLIYAIAGGFVAFAFFNVKHDTTLIQAICRVEEATGQLFTQINFATPLACGILATIIYIVVFVLARLRMRHLVSSEPVLDQDLFATEMAVTKMMFIVLAFNILKVLLVLLPRRAFQDIDSDAALASHPYRNITYKLISFANVIVCTVRSEELRLALFRVACFWRFAVEHEIAMWSVPKELGLHIREDQPLPELLRSCSAWQVPYSMLVPSESFYSKIGPRIIQLLPSKNPTLSIILINY